MGKLGADRLRKDARLVEAKRLILEAFSDHQQGLDQIRAPSNNLQLAYAKLAEKAEGIRGAPLWFPYIGSGIGSGPFVELADGSVKLDLINGIGVHYGHGIAELIESAVDAVTDDLVMQGNLEQNREGIHLMEELASACDLPHCFLTTSGAMAVENGLKMAFQKHAPRRRLIAFENAFHGRTCTLAQITDRPQYREGLPLNLDVDYLPFHPGDALKTLESIVQAHPRQHAAFLFEPVQGEGGIYRADREFFLPLLQMLRAHDIAIIADEVQTFGRCARLLACQDLKLMDLIDIVTIGKLSHVCATLFKSPYNPDPGLISQTFTSSTSAIYAARKVLGWLKKGGKRRRELHHYLEKGLKAFEPQISGPYGVGLMCAFTVPEAAAFVRRLYDNGLITFVAGQKPQRVRMLLPPCIEVSHLDLALEIIGKTLKEVG